MRFVTKIKIVAGLVFWASASYVQLDLNERFDYGEKNKTYCDQTAMRVFSLIRFYYYSPPPSPIPYLDRFCLAIAITKALFGSHSSLFLLERGRGAGVVVPTASRGRVKVEILEEDDEYCIRIRLNPREWCCYCTLSSRFWRPLIDYRVSEDEIFSVICC